MTVDHAAMRAASTVKVPTMSDLTNAMGAGLLGRPTVNTDSPMRDILAELVQTAGSGKGAAALLGVSPTTFYRWRNAAEGKERGISQQPKVGRKAMVSAIRRASLGAGTERRVRTGAVHMKITGMVHVSKGSRKRTISPGQYITNRKMGNILTSWLNADDARADRLIEQGIDAHYVEGMSLDTVETVEFGS